MFYHPYAWAYALNINTFMQRLLNCMIILLFTLQTPSLAENTAQGQWISGEYPAAGIAIDYPSDILEAEIVDFFGVDMDALVSKNEEDNILIFIGPGSSDAPSPKAFASLDELHTFILERYTTANPHAEASNSSIPHLLMQHREKDRLIMKLRLDSLYENEVTYFSARAFAGSSVKPVLWAIYPLDKDHIYAPLLERITASARPWSLIAP